MTLNCFRLILYLELIWSFVMKVETINLKDRDVVYIYGSSPMRMNDNSQTCGLFRLENVNGKLEISLLPDYYPVEDDIKNVYISNGNGIVFVSHTCESLLLMKKSSKVKDIYIKELCCIGRNASHNQKNELFDLAYLIAGTQYHDANQIDVMAELYTDALNNYMINTGDSSVLFDEADKFDPKTDPIYFDFKMRVNARQDYLEAKTKLNNDEITPE